MCSASIKGTIVLQGAINGVFRIHTYAKETNSLSHVRGKIYCSTLAYALEAFPVCANKVSYHMAYATIFL